MSNDKEVIKKLLKIVANQQKIITKVAQNLESFQRPSTHLPENSVKDPAAMIQGALPNAVQSSIQRLEVHGGPGVDSEVRVKFHPGKDSDAAFSAIQKTVQHLQKSNVLPAASYVVKQV